MIRFVSFNRRVVTKHPRDTYHEQSYIFVNTIVNKSSYRRIIVLHYKGNQSKCTIVVGLFTTVHETGTRTVVVSLIYHTLTYTLFLNHNNRIDVKSHFL